MEKKAAVKEKMAMALLDSDVIAYHSDGLFLKPAKITIERMLDKLSQL